MKKRYIVLAAGAVILAANFFLSQNQKQEENSSENETVQVQRKLPKKQTAKTSIELAEETLENTGELLGKEETDQTLEALTIAFDYLEGFEDLAGVRQTYKNRLSLTNGQMLQTLATMVITGYRFDAESLKVYASDSENVHQFIFTMSEEGRETLAFAGNYVPGTGQLEIALMQGTPSPKPDLGVEEPQLSEEKQKVILKELQEATENK